MKTTAVILTICYSFLFSIATFGAEQTPEDHNYIKTRTYSEAAGQTYYDDINYFDGLGKLRQVNNKEASPTSKDMVTMTEYDGLGRRYKVWLPTPVTADGNYVQPAILQGVAKSAGGHSDPVPYTTYLYEDTPFQRPLEEKRPGEAFQVAAATTRQGYYLNDLSDSLSCWQLELDDVAVPTSAVRCVGVAAANTICVSHVLGPDDIVGYEFTNARGQLILQRQKVNQTSYADTYYVYDQRGNLSYVLPPMLSARITSGALLQPSSTQMAGYAFMYDYDHRNRCIGKKFPGKGWEWMVYDKADRLVLSQDGNMRTDEDGQPRTAPRWLYNVYDNLNRLVSTSLVEQQTALTRQQIQDRYNASGFDNSYPILGGSPDPYKPFADESFALVTILSENKYGNGNSALQDANSRVIISEIFYDSPLNEQIATGVAYSNGEFLELYNCGSQAVDMSGWVLTGGGVTEVFTFPAGTTIQPNGHILVAYQYNNSDFRLGQLFDGLSETGTNRQVIYQRKIILSNGGEQLTLKDAQGNIRDAVFYDGTSNKTKPNRLSATNEDGASGWECQSIQRVIAAYQVEDPDCAITDNTHWTTATVSPFSQKPGFTVAGSTGTVGYSGIPEYLYFDPDWCFFDAPDNRVNGLKIYDRNLILEGDNFRDPTCVERAYYYNDKGRVIQAVEKNHLGGISRTNFQYDFVGNVEYLHEEVQPGENAPIHMKATLNSYDRRNRLYETITYVDGEHDGSTMYYDYDELGRLVRKYYAHERFANAVVETYDYNIQGWLIEQEACQDGRPHFRSMLYYHYPTQRGSTPSYSGNISEWEWQYGGVGIPDSPANCYAFTYDKLNRLIDTKQYIDEQLTNDYIERPESYDLNGNLQYLTRTSAGHVNDEYSYHYTGNQLTGITDETGNPHRYDYSYDVNGNMTHDGLNNIDLKYNHLDLVKKAESAGVTLANYTYLSDGTKLSVADNQGGGYEYLGSFVFQRLGDELTLESVAYDGGRLMPFEGNWRVKVIPHYHLTDHLGSVRVVVDGEGEVKERSDYYPFGKRWEETNDRISDNRYRYNGKEEQQAFGLPYIDYGARMYDPTYRLGWNGSDPLASKYFLFSPYAFCANNPLNVIDYDGRDIIVLRNSKGAGRLGHAALLIGSNDTGWTYISKDGYTNLIPRNSPSKYIVKSFGSLEEFSNSSHNYDLKSGKHSTEGGKEAATFDFELDDKGNKIVRYDQALLIETTQADGSSTDAAAIDAATKEAQSNYTLGSRDCSHVVTKALKASKDKDGNQIKDGEKDDEGDKNKAPNTKFNYIRQNNPNARHANDLSGPGMIRDDWFRQSTGLGADPGQGN
jgi:RHS repeat-associated core domain